MKNGRKFSERVENTVGKGDIACYKQIPPFSTVLSKDKQVKSKVCLEKG